MITLKILKKHLKKLPYRKIFFNLFLLAVIGLVLVVFAFLYYAKQVPDPSVITERRVTESTKIYDRTGNVLL